MGTVFTLKNKRHMPWLLARIIAGIMRLYAWTIRLKIEDADGNIHSLASQGKILTMWHNRLLFIMPFFPKAYRRYTHALISSSRDGEYIATIARCFGVPVVRGSSSRGGANALLAMEGCIKSGGSVVVTVDGPRGPKYTVHPGAAYLAKSTGAEIVPMALNYKRYWQLKSWDRMQVPVPFTNATLKIGHSLALPADMTVEKANEIIADALNDVSVDKE